MKQIISCILLTVIIISNIACANKEDKTMLSGQPFFSIHYKTSGCAYEIHLNDVPIDQNENGGPMETTIPVNQWIVNGNNKISVYLHSQPNAEELAKISQNCDITVKLLMGQNKQSKNQDVTISSIHYHSSPITLTANQNALNGSSKAGYFHNEPNHKISISHIDIHKDKNTPNKLVLNRSITLASPFPQWAWTTSDKITNDNETKKELLLQYHNIWSSLKNNNLKPLASQLAERAKEMAQAMYLSLPTDNGVSILQDEVNNRNLTLGPDIMTVPEKYIHLQIFGDGKLARLARWDNGPVIFFNEQDKSSSDGYDFIFRKEGSKWVITR